MRPANLLFIISDQHNRDISGCYGDPLVQTPHLDRLAARGTRFTNAYTTCPICVPARASLASGRYVHQTGHWDNAHPYHGELPSWHHRLREQGHPMDLIGKLHFRSAQDDNGFRREIEPLHVVDGIGDVLSCIRENPPYRDNTQGVREAGPGHSTYLQYDIRNADNAVAWLKQAPARGLPWCLFVSFVCPHPPYIAPQTLYSLYPLEDVPMPPQWRRVDWPHHPDLDYFRQFFGIRDGFDEEDIRKVIAAYYGAITHVDLQIGRVLQALEANGLAENTRIIYTSDHGESRGARGLFGKFTMYEEAAAVPLIMAGPDLPAGAACQTPVSFVDLFPTVLECVGVAAKPEDGDLPGESLWRIAQEADAERTVLSEYHAVGSRNGVFMLRDRRYKYIHYVNQRPQLFDLLEDPEEVEDLAERPGYEALLNIYESQLRELLNPEVVDAQAKESQRRMVEAAGGLEAVQARGTFDNSPTPGENPAFRQYLHNSL